MALFEPHRTRESEEIVVSDAATRALSVTVVDNDLVAGVYEKLAGVYDFTFGPVLHPGRVDAIERMAIKPGDRVLEVGVGTGINAALYPTDCSVTGIDLSSSMLEIARERVARKGVRNVRLLQMDAANLKFADDTFDIVYAPYVISVVPDPVAVTREMVRVCRPGGRIVILNHFRSKSRVGAWLERLQVRPRSARVSGAGRPEPGVNREGQHPADLEPGHVRQKLKQLSTVNSQRSRLNPQRDR
jgi:phosphatidylethanolamine/phosphatidyl-N-methylethanolamine N-methyltransferase